MKREERYEIERTKWDSVAEHRLAEGLDGSTHETFNEYARRDPLLVGVAEFLGDLRGRRVLEYGCGLGKISVLLAKGGASVTAFDISPKSIEAARRRAEINGVEDSIEFQVAAAENLPFADGRFDVAFGKAVLHHLDVEAAAPELARVLTSHGRAAFSEPMGMNPVLNFVRERVPYPHKTPRGADRPLNYDEIAAWGRPFSEYRYREVQLLSMIERGFGFGKRLSVLRRMDDSLLTRFPRLRRYCRYVTMFMVK